VPADHLVQLMGKGNVVGDHRAVTFGSDLLEAEPDLESPEPPRVLRSVLEVILDLLPFVVIELVVVGLESERIAQRRRVPRQETASLEGAVEPLVGIDGDRVRES